MSDAGAVVLLNLTHAVGFGIVTASILAIATVALTMQYAEAIIDDCEASSSGADGRGSVPLTDTRQSSARERRLAEVLP